MKKFYRLIKQNKWTFAKTMPEIPPVVASYLIRFISKIKINSKYVYYFCLSHSHAGHRDWPVDNIVVEGASLVE